MPAFVSLAFALLDPPSTAVARTRALLPELELELELGEEETAEDTTTLEGVLTVAGSPLRAWLRAYAQPGWTALTLDVEEDALDRLSREVGRPIVLTQLVELGARFVRTLGAPYVWFEEEAEADHEPSCFTGAEPLFGVSLLRADLPALGVALATPGLLRVERAEGVVIVWKRPDPVPHRTR